jgi:tubulin-like protein
MKSNVVFRPTVVIGLGGTGYGAVLKLKKHFRDAYGSVPQIIRFLTFDTTETVEHSERARDGLPVTLEPRTERHIIQVANPAGLLGNGNEHIDSWWPRNIPISAIVAGAGQVRARGRLALFAKSEEIITAIREAIRDVNLIKSRKEMYKDDFLVSERGGVEIYIVASLAGGTGSGMFLDAAFIARSFVDSTSNITGVLVLPGIFAGKAGVHLVKPNSFGALKELEQFSNLGLQNHFTIEYGTYHRVEARQPPFDLVYLIDNTNELGRGIKETAELQSIIAQGMYLQIGSQIGTNKENTVDNIKTQLSTAGRVRGRSASYCSFGVGTLTLPVRQFEAMEVDATRRLLSNGLLSGDFPDEELDAEVVRFIHDNKLREDDSDDVIDTLAEQEKGVRMRFPMPLGQIVHFDNTAQALIKHLHATHRSRMEQQVAQQMEENYKELLGASLRAVDDWWEATINHPNGSTHAARFIRKFASRLESYQHTMESEAREQGTAVNFHTAEEQIKQAAEAAFGRAAKVKAACENYRGLVNRECELHIEKVRRDKAADLYGVLRARVNELSERCEGIRQKMKGALQMLEQQYVDAAAMRGGDSPFEHTLKFDNEQHRPVIPHEDFVQWHQRNYGSLSAWSVVHPEDIARELRDFVKERYQSLTGLTIDEVFRSAADPERVGRELGQLNHLSVPLWHYNDAKIPLNKRNIITELYHYGVADAEDTALRDLKIASHVPRGTTELSYVSTQDPQRIMLFKVRVGIPLFALYDIEEMESAYNDPDKNVSNHIHVAWESFPNPISRIDEGDAMRWFAIAQAPSPLGLISARAGSYYMRSKKARFTDNGELPLERGRVRAYEKFKQDRDLIKEVEENVAAVLRTDSEAKVSELLRDHVEHLLTQARLITDSTIKEQVELEVQEIQNYLQQLMTIH